MAQNLYIPILPVTKFQVGNIIIYVCTNIQYGLILYTHNSGLNGLLYKGQTQGIH